MLLLKSSKFIKNQSTFMMILPDDLNNKKKLFSGDDKNAHNKL